MRKDIYNLIKLEYEKKQKKAFDILSTRKSEVYTKIPRIQEIESQIQLAGVKYTKMIIMGSSPDEAIAGLHEKIVMLKEEKEQLLNSFKYPTNYLESTYNCSKCKDTGFIEGSDGSEKCSCYKQQLLNFLYNQSNLNLAEKENFSSFNEAYYSNGIDEKKYNTDMSPLENILDVKEHCLRFIEDFASPNGKNLFFCGPTGVGKTFMSNCIASELLNRGITVLYQTAPVLFNTISEFKMNAFKEENTQDLIYKDIFEVELLIIDDLGTESKTASRYAELLTILNTRQMNNLKKPCKTIISTNIGAKELYKYYDERVASRIIGDFDMFRFIGNDIRCVKNSAGNI